MMQLGGLEQTNWNVEQGADWQFGQTWKQGGVAVDLTGARVDLWSKRDVNDPDSSAIKLSSAGVNPVITIPSPATGRYAFSAPGALTAAWNGQYVYDVKITLANGFIKRSLQGLISLDPEVTV